MDRVQLISLDLDGTLLDPRGKSPRRPGTPSPGPGRRGCGWSSTPAARWPRPSSMPGRRAVTAWCPPWGARRWPTPPRGGVLRRWDVPEDSGRRVLELCLGRDIELMIFAGEEIVLDPFSKASLMKTFPFPVFHDRAVVADDPLAYLAAHRLPLTKLHGDQAPGRYPLDELAALPGVQLTAANAHDFELVAAGVDKGRALAMIALLYGVPWTGAPPWGTATTTWPSSGRWGPPSPWATPPPR